MINVGDNNISGVYLGDEELSVYIGDELIYPLNFGTLTAITLDNLTWVTDIPYSGGTGTSANCSYIITGYYDSGKTRKLNSFSVVDGEITASSTTSETRDLVGTLVLTATCSGFSATGSVDAYQEKYAPYPENNEIWYTTSDGQTITPSGLSPISNTYSGGKGVMTFSSPVTSIPANCFKSLTALTSVVCPSSVTSLGKTIINGSYVSAFTCEYATSLDFDHCLGFAPKLLSYKNNVVKTTTGYGPFEGNTSMTDIELTAITSLTYYCFNNCQSLTGITFGATPPTIKDYTTFRGVPSSGTFYVPSASVSAYETWKSSGYNSTPIRNWTVVGY